jgi:hypothetical protein
MALRNRTILLVSPEPWEHIPVSKHHYARTLAAMGNAVYFLGPPESDYSIAPTAVEHLYRLSYPGFVRGLRFHPAFSRRKHTREVVEALEAAAGATFDVIWSFDNSVFYDFDALPDSVLKISHIVDLNMDHQTARAARSADLCLCTTQLIRERLMAYNARSYALMHGVQSWPEDANENARQLPGQQPLKAVYVGNLAMKYLDWTVLRKSAEEHPEVDFVLYGPNAQELSTDLNPTHADKAAMLNLPNCHFPGRISPEEIPYVLAGADLLLLAYQKKHLRDQANPHKVMEYLQSGKPIAANYTAEFADTNLFTMSGEDHQWGAVFTQVLQNLEAESSPEKVAARKAFAAGHTYEKQLERIEEILLQCGLSVG